MLTRISVIGAPESGKSAFALALSDAIVRHDVGCVECLTPIDIVDDYAEEVGELHNNVVGFEADYIVNLAIALDRRSRERASFLENNAKTVITVGSVLETSTYTAMDFESRSLVNSESEAQDDIRRVEATMKTLACLYVDTFNPTYAFYLPPLVGGDKEEIKTFDRNLQAAFQAFNLVTVHPLLVDDGNIFEITQQRVDKALEIMFKENDAEGTVPGEDTATEVADGSGVSQG